jgi:hypothetical protein
MKNEINSELLTNLIEEFIINNKNLFKPYLKEKDAHKTESNDEYDYESGLTEKDQRIKKFYDELRYIHNMRDISYAELSKKIEDVKEDIERKTEETFHRLKETDYINSFILKNNDSITDEKIDEFVEYLKDKGFYPLDKQKLKDYINSIEVTEEEIPFKSEELKTKLDEEFREYVLRFMNLIDKQRIKFGISEDKFKKMVLKVLKVNETDLSEPKYDYKTKKYALLKEIAETTEDINPFYIVKYYNIETGKVYYSVYYENGTLEYSMLESYDEAVSKAKTLIRVGGKPSDRDKTSTKNITNRNTSTKEKSRTKEQDRYKREDMSLTYEDEEIISDQEFIKKTIQDIHYRQDQKLSEIGDRRFFIFRIIAWVLGFTLIFTPFSFMIFLALRTHEALTGKAKSKSKTFLKITKFLGWLFIFSVVGLPIGIPLLMLTYITENAEHKYKIELNKGKSFASERKKATSPTSFDEQDIDYDSFISVKEALEQDWVSSNQKVKAKTDTDKTHKDISPTDKGKQTIDNRDGEDKDTPSPEDTDSDNDIDFDAIDDDVIDDDTFVEEDAVKDYELFNEKQESHSQIEAEAELKSEHNPITTDEDLSQTDESEDQGDNAQDEETDREDQSGDEHQT